MKLGLGPALEQSLDRVPVAHVERDAIQHDLVGVQLLHDRLDIRVREHIEPMLVEEDVPAMLANLSPDLGRLLGLRLDHQWVHQGRFRDLPLPRRTALAVRRKRLPKIGVARNLSMFRDVIVGAGDDPDAPRVRVVGEALQIRDDALGVRHVQLPVRVHEIVLGIHIPEDQAGHGQLRVSMYDMDARQPATRGGTRERLTGP